LFHGKSENETELHVVEMLEALKTLDVAAELKQCR